ncbi:MAG: DUF4825 domain-containing protein [Tissierella sp.]|nr:DUF4825 domain-containing protein [Tissierella sp.]
MVNIDVIKRRLNQLSSRITRKKYIMSLFMSVLIISSGLSVACSIIPVENLETNKSDELYKLKGTYIGDNSKVGNIINLLDFPEELTPNGIELFTDEEPFGLQINFQARDEVIGAKFWSSGSDYIWRSPSVILFSLIDNLDYIQYTIVGDNLLQSTVHTDREAADTLTMSTLGHKVSEVGNSKELFEEFYNIYSSDESVDGTVEYFAWEYINNEIKMYENAEWADYKFIDQEIIKLEKLSTFDNILSSPVELWRLEYRLKPENPEELVLAGGLEIVDGWLIDNGINGKPHLAFTHDNGDLVYLGNANAIEFDLDTLASQEIAIRIMLENMEILPRVTYEGNHVVIKFPLSTGETAQLLLSQPIKQGNGGIWVVERWMDGNGYIYHHIPIHDIRIEEHYRDLQERFENGENLFLDKPVDVAMFYINLDLGQVQVDESDLEIINPATVEDFLKTPESDYIGYITMMSIDEELFHLDKIEFLTQEDEERASELGIDTNYDMPSGFYVHNPETYPDAFDTSDETNYLLLDYNNLSEHKSVSKEEFVEYNNSLGYSPLYHIYTRNGYVRLIKEQYIP